MGSSLLGLIAISMAALSLTYSGHPLIQSIVGATTTFKDSLYVQSMVQSDKTTYVYIVTYNRPSSFTDFAFEYLPNDVYFDQYSVQPQYHQWTDMQFNIGRRSDKSVVANDPKKVCIRTVAGYTQKADNDAKYLDSITVQFFYNTASHDPEFNKIYLPKFKNMFSNGAFMRYTVSNSPQQVKLWNTPDSTAFL